LLHELLQLVESGSYDFHAPAVGCQAEGSGLTGNCIPVKAEEAEPGVGVKDGDGMSGAAEGGVDVEAVGYFGKEVHDAFEEDRDVMKRR